MTAKSRRFELYIDLLNKMSQSIIKSALLLSLFFPAISWAGNGNDSNGLGLVSVISIAIISASIITIIFNRLKLPALLAYITAGLLIGAIAGKFLGDSLYTLHEVAHIGLVFLLFIIGMEIDVTAIRILGAKPAIAIVLQAPVSFTFVYGIQWAASHWGVTLPGLANHSDGWFYYAVAASLGSTAVVVKLLGDRFDLGSQAGKITVMTLICGDLWAIIALCYVQSQGNGSGTNIGLIIGGGLLLLVACLLFGYFLLPRIIKSFEKSPDLMMLIAMGWCFLSAQAFEHIGLSAEMGALIAGLNVGRLPQHAEIFSKAVGLRDFFMALFFVSLGISLPVPTLDVIVDAICFTFIVVFVRLLLYTPKLLAAAQGPIVSFAVSNNLSQISVFALLLLPIGIANGALKEHDQLVISFALFLSAVLTAFIIPNTYRLAALFSNLLGLKTKSISTNTRNEEDDGHHAEIIMLGYFINGAAIAREIQKTDPELFKRILVIDFNTDKKIYKEYPDMNVKYGDFSQPDTLHHCGIEHAKVVVSPINNAFLHGIRNEELLKQVKQINPNIKFIATCLSERHSQILKEHGAFEAISTPDESAPAYVNAIMTALVQSESEGEYLTDEPVMQSIK